MGSGAQSRFSFSLSMSVLYPQEPKAGESLSPSQSRVLRATSERQGKMANAEKKRLINCVEQFTKVLFLNLETHEALLYLLRSDLATDAFAKY